MTETMIAEQTREVCQRAEQLFRTACDRGLDLGCLLISIDRLRRYDDPVRLLLRQALEGLVLTDPEGGSWRVLRMGDELVLLCPELALGETGAVARRLAEGARALRIRHGQRQLQVRLSIGVAHNRNRGELDLEVLLGVARESLGVAQIAGGDRWVHTELYDLIARRVRNARTRREASLAFDFEELSAGTELAPEPEPTQEPEASTEAAEQTAESAESGVELGSLPAVLGQLMKDIDGGDDPFARALENRPSRRVEVLERRIAKLLQALELAEGEILRLQREFGTEAGIASVYRRVQGLAPDEPLAEVKRRLMQELYRANEALRRTAS